jgi:hypothetical protein
MHDPVFRSDRQNRDRQRIHDEVVDGHHRHAASRS